MSSQCDEGEMFTNPNEVSVSSFLTLDGILHMLLLHIINLDLTMLIEKQKQLLWDMWESVQHSDHRKDTMN